MKKESDISPKFVDGVIKLHSELDKAFKDATNIVGDLLGSSMKVNKFSTSYSIYVESNESSNSDRIKGYFMVRNTIFRFLPFEFDKALLFPVHNHGGGDFKTGKGILIKEINKILQKEENFRILFSQIRTIDKYNFFNVSLVPSIKIPSIKNDTLDDIGKPYYLFPDLKKLSIVDVPQSILSEKYTLVGSQHYAPLTKNTDINCVLFAQLDNEFDSKAIKVLRWFPVCKGGEVEQILGMSSNGGDIFFELGYVSRQENEILHSFMVSTNSRVLFGELINGKIKITGGVKSFQTNELKYPRCLYNVKLS